MTTNTLLQTRPLGRTGLHVSPIALGTVALGLDYGIQTPMASSRPAAEEAIALIRAAAEAGVNLFDTAPGYATAEELVGAALAVHERCAIATKVTLPRAADGQEVGGMELRQALELSIDKSRRALRRDVLDIVQLHNPTVETFVRGEVAEIMLGARQAGKLRFLGASVYTEAEALAAIATDWVEVLQVAYNLLDQRMARRVFDAASEQGVAIITRSAFLKGALTEKAAWLPPELARLQQAVEQVSATLRVSWQELPQAALRFCLGEPRVASVLLGCATREELAQALTAIAAGPLPASAMDLTPGLALEDATMIDPRHWPIP